MKAKLVELKLIGRDWAISNRELTNVRFEFAIYVGTHNDDTYLCINENFKKNG